MSAHNPGPLKDTEARRLAGFVTTADAGTMTGGTRDELLKRVLDSIGVAIGALDGEPIGYVRAHIADFGGAPHCTLIGGGKTAPDRAAFYNGALV
ncbi:MAG TPA: MmgE/PrpD family protein, partial [Gemmatimonadales bacterium]|nr:MmgE/PrpD family protein [Gemmatimonadales bacterium]